MPAEPDLARLLIRAHRGVERAMMRRVAAAGLDMLRPGHFTVLRALDPGPEGIRITDLARDADITRQAVQQIVADLAELGIVETSVDPTDARARIVRYTPYGRSGYDQCLAEFARMDAELTQALGPRRMAALRKALLDTARAVE